MPYYAGPGGIVRTQRRRSAEKWQVLAGLTFSALSDPNSLVSTLELGDGGVLSAVFQSSTTIIGGYQNGIARRTARLLDLIPDLDPSVDEVDIGLVYPDTSHHATTDGGLVVGIADSATVDASLAACVGTVRSVTALTDNLGRMGTTGQSSSNNLGLISAAQWSTRWCDTGSGYQPQFQSAGLIEGTTRWDDGAVQSAEVMRTDLDAWVLLIGAFHNSTDDVAGYSVSPTLYWRRRRLIRDIG